MKSEKPYKVVMPKLGLIMTEALLVEWYQQDGEWMEAGEPLFALESDKSTIEIEAPASGYVQILVPAGQTVPVMTPVAILAKEAGDKAVMNEVNAPSAIIHDSPQPQTAAGLKNSRDIRATPMARKLARSQGIDLSELQGRGPRGMIIAANLQQRIQPPSVKATPLARKLAREFGLDLFEVVGTGRNGSITRSDVEKSIAAKMTGHVAAGPDKTLPLSGLRGVIAERLAAGWHERPQVTLTTEIDATNLVSARRQWHAETGRKLSYNTLFMAAAAQVLLEQPHVNIQLTQTGITQMPEINIGLAVDTERGLLVPVVRRADTKPLAVLDTEIATLAQRALEGEALPDDLSSGTFTITNLGAFGIDAFTPIVNPPEVAILGIGRISPRPFAVGRQLEVRDTVTLSLSFDHRLLDGGPAAKFLQRIGELIERPVLLFKNQ
jgi:pyruvate dehydrogenase E2 component (dihydrolipoamide acetyltransferase)